MLDGQKDFKAKSKANEIIKKYDLDQSKALSKNGECKYFKNFGTNLNIELNLSYLKLNRIHRSFVAGKNF